jgi:PAS domain S-box-containing protein
MAFIAKPPFSSFNFFDALFNHTVENSILLMDSNGKIIRINKAFTDRFGYTEDYLKGKNASILFTEEDQKKGRPEKEIAGVHTCGQAADNNYLVKKSGEVIWVSGESILVKNDEGDICILKVIQDINQQKLNEKSALLFSNLNEHILAAIDDVVIVMDMQLNILKTNHAFNLFNTAYRKEGSSFEELIKPYDLNGALINRIKNTIKHKTTFTHQALEIQSASGEKRFYDFNCSLLLHTEEGSRVLLVIHDITIDKQIEKEREDVIGFVAHELRNPLANLVLCNDLMSEALQDDSDIDLSNLLQRSKNNISRLNKMIAELYEATRVNSGLLKLETETFHFGEMIRESIETVEILQPSYNIIAEGDSDLLVTGDRYRLIQVVTNFINNGIKYSNGKKDVTLTISHDDKTVTVSVKDEGLGISPENLAHVFERFFRAEKTKNLEGIGLGLFLCQQIITAHHGITWAESEEGKGSVFYFSIPMQGTLPDE